LTDKMKGNNYHTIRIVPNFYRKIADAQ
jgi:hypothetical protein